MRVSFDTNILISYLLHIDPERTPNRIIHAAFSHRFDLILSETTLGELVSSVEAKPYLAARIDAGVMNDFAARLRLLATIVPEVTETIPAVTRDPADDYLIAHAVLQNVDFLVTGDKDLLVLGEVAGVRIISQAAFVSLLDELP